jgi:hypothetical protein
VAVDGRSFPARSAALATPGTTGKGDVVCRDGDVSRETGAGRISGSAAVVSRETTGTQPVGALSAAGSGPIQPVGTAEVTATPLTQRSPVALCRGNPTAQRCAERLGSRSRDALPRALRPRSLNRPVPARTR